MPKKRVLIFGWDGIPRSVIEEAVEKGYLKNLRRLIEDSVFGGIDAVLPIVTPANWYSAFTGVKTERHGIPNFVAIDRDYKLRYMSITDLKVSGLWNYIDSMGMKGIYVNIPISTPAPKVNGIWISDEEVLKDPKEYHVYPKEILYEISRYGYKVGYPFPSGYPRRFSREILDVENTKLETFHKLLVKYEWNLAIYIARSPDHLLHLFLDVPGYMDEVYHSIKLLDDWLGRFIEEFGDEASYIIFSDHGHKRKKGYINLVSILRKRGLLSIGSQGRLRAYWVRRNKLVRYIWGKLSPNLRRKISKNILDKFLEIDSPSRILTSLINWRETKVFPNVNVGGLKVNIAQDFVHGNVPKEEKKRLIENIANILSQLEINRDKMFKEVYLVDTNDPYIPDILLEPNDNYWFSASRSEEEVLPLDPPEIRDDKKIDINQNKISYHIREGFYLISGEGLKRGFGPKLFMPDITPITLYMLGLPIPTNLDGKLNPELFEESFIKENPPRYRSYRKSIIKTKVKKIRKKLVKK